MDLTVGWKSRQQY